MHCGNVTLSFPPIILLCCLCLGACAPTPWTTLIEDDRRQSIEDSYRGFTESQNQCISGWDADIVINWKSSLNGYSFPAYLQALPPSYFKLVVANPLGQPLKLLSTDGADYKFIDVIKRSSIYGSTRSWAVRYDLPYTMINRSWPDWLQGRPDGGKQRLITEIKQDNEDRGVWLTIADVEKDLIEEQTTVVQDLVEGAPGEGLKNAVTDTEISYPIYEYLLVDAETGIVKEQIIIDEQQKPQATIVYNQWQQTDACLYPVDIEITGLPYGAHIHLEFSEIQQADLTPDDFTITIPPGYSRTMMP